MVEQWNPNFVYLWKTQPANQHQTMSKSLWEQRLTPVSRPIPKKVVGLLRWSATCCHGDGNGPSWVMDIMIKSAFWALKVVTDCWRGFNHSYNKTRLWWNYYWGRDSNRSTSISNSLSSKGWDQQPADLEAAWSWTNSDNFRLAFCSVEDGKAFNSLCVLRNIERVYIKLLRSVNVAEH